MNVFHFSEVHPHTPASHLPEFAEPGTARLPDDPSRGATAYAARQTGFRPAAPTAADTQRAPEPIAFSHRPPEPARPRAMPGLPDAYLGTPAGTLTPDSRHSGVFNDTAGQAFISSGGNRYAVRYDPANGTWRVVQRQDPVKPGIAVERNEDGGWSRRDDVGMRGGSPNDRAETSRRVLTLARDAQRTVLSKLALNERTAQIAVELEESNKAHLEEQIAAMEARGEDTRAARRLLPVLQERLTEAQMTMRDTRNFQYAAMTELRDTEQRLKQLPPRGDANDAGTSSGHGSASGHRSTDGRS